VPDDALAALARHAEAVATVRAFAARSGAERVVLVVDPGDGSTATMVEWVRGAPLELTEGDTTWAITAHVDAPPRAFGELRPPPATTLAIEPETGDLEAPLGAIANLGRAVIGLAAAFGGRSVATADFATRNPQLPLTIAGRDGEPLVFAVGDRRFVLSDGAL
jgi:hypothetical protein